MALLNTASSRPSPFDAPSLEGFLNTYVEYKKSVRPTWSLTVWSRQLGIKGAGTLANILQGRRVPSMALARKMSRSMGLTEYEEDYWLTMVEQAQKHHSDFTRLELRRRMGRIHPRQSHRQHQVEAFESISNSLYFSIRELVALKCFREDPQWIAKKLSLYSVSTEEVEAAIESLIRLNLLERDSSGRLVQKDGLHETPSEFHHEATRRYHEDVGALAVRSIREIAPEHRHFNSATVSVREEDLPEFKRFINEACREAIRLFCKDGGDQVYHLNLQLFPVGHEDEAP